MEGFKSRERYTWLGNDCSKSFRNWVIIQILWKVNLERVSESPRGLLKIQIVGPPPKGAELGWRPNMFISN